MQGFNRIFAILDDGIVTGPCGIAQNLQRSAVVDLRAFGCVGGQRMNATKVRKKS